MAPFDRQNKKN